MGERLTDEFIAAVLNRTHPAEPDDIDVALAREVQATRLALNGGPCPTCQGDDFVVHLDHGMRELHPCHNPDCVDGRVPGVVERLELVHARLLGVSLLTVHGQKSCEEVTAVLADLRRLAGES